MDMQESTVEAGRGPLISRRAVGIGAAWTVPVIITAVAAPTASASSVPAVASAGSMVKGDGQNYTLTLSFQPPKGSSVAIKITSVAGTSDNAQVTFDPVPQSQTVTFDHPDAVYSLQRNGDNSGSSVVVTYTVAGGSPQTMTITITTPKGH